MPPIEFYKPVLAIEVAWHPRFAEGRRIAETIYGLLKRSPAVPGSGGLGIPVLFRSAPAAGGAVPAATPFGDAQHTAVVLLVDDEMVIDDAWVAYAERLLAAAGDGHRVYPVQLSESAFNLSTKLAAVNFMRPLEGNGPPDAAATTQLMIAMLHELCMLLTVPPRDAQPCEGVHQPHQG